MPRTLSKSCSKLLNEYHRVIDTANDKVIPCYIAASLIGITPASYIALLNEMQGEYQDVLDTLRSTDLSNFLAAMQDIEKSVNVDLFKPLFSLPDDIDDDIPTVEITFLPGDFACESVNEK